MSDAKADKKGGLRRFFIGILVVLAVLGCWKASVTYGERKAEDRAMALVQSGRFEEAAVVIEDLRFRTGSLERKERLRPLLADCYLKLAEKPENAGDRSLGYYAKLSMLAPEKIPDNIRVQLNRKQKH